MSGIESVAGAGLLVDQEYRITDGNDRCAVVFEESLASIRGEQLDVFVERGLCDEESLTRWKRAVDLVAATADAEETDQITLEPGSQENEYVYNLTVEPADDGLACCVLDSAGTQRGYEETLTALHESTRNLLDAESVEEVLHRTAVAAGDVLGFPGTGVRRHNAEEGVLEHVSLGARVEDIDARPPYPVDDSPHGRAIRRQETIIETITDDEDPYDRGVFSQTMYVPIGTDGLLSVGTLGGTFDQSDLQFAEILAENAAAAIAAVQTTASLRQERQQLELLRQILSRVLRHNIRNDMSIVKSSAEVIDDRTGQETDMLVEQIYESVENITTLSKKARQIGQIIDEPDQRRKTNLAETLDHVSNQVSMEYPELTVETDLERPCVVSAHHALGLGLRNLLENAVQHTDGSPTRAHVSTTVDAETVTLCIEDDGPGIPPDEVDVLEMETETALHHGSGLGLWIVKWVVEQSDGQIEFDGCDGTQVEIVFDRYRED